MCRATVRVAFSSRSDEGTLEKVAGRGSAVRPGPPGVLVVSHRELVAVANERCDENPGHLRHDLEPPVVRIVRSVQPEIQESARLPVDERVGPELLDEPPKLPLRRRLLLEVDEVDRHPALLEEALGLARVLARLRAEDLDIHGSASSSWSFVSSVKSLFASSCPAPP